MSDFSNSRVWRKVDADEEAHIAESRSFLVQYAISFCNALDELPAATSVLGDSVTPESRPSWGDFSVARDMLPSEETRGYASETRFAEGEPRVGYLSIFRGANDTVQNISGQEQMTAARAVLTLVWRADFDRWMVHAIGDYVHPNDVPFG